jgi:cytoskeletal protein RodZ
LVQKRELNDVASELNMAERQVVALEADDYKALPEPTFIKGYYRAYAKLLGIDATPLITRFNEIYTSDTGLPNNHALENSPLKVLGRVQRRNKSTINWLKLLSVLVVVGLVLWALIAGVRAWHHHKKVAEQADTTATTTDISTTPTSTSGATVLSLPSTPASQHDQLALSFKHPVSVEIKDSTGKTLASGKQDKALNLEGDSPFSIRLDDAAAVTLSLNNEQVSLTPYTVNGRADFRLSR